MTVRTRTTLKGYFIRNAKPSQSNYSDLIDSFKNITDDDIVDSVNGQTGAVVLDPDDLDDTSTTNKFTTSGDISKLAGIEAGAQVNTVDSVNGQTGAVVLTQAFIIACSDEVTALTTGTAKTTFRMPYAFTITEVRASLTGAGSTSGTTTIDINEGGTTILSTKLTIDYGELTSTTATTPAVISDSSLADDSIITIDIDAVTGGANETGLKVYIIGHKS